MVSLFNLFFSSFQLKTCLLFPEVSSIHTLEVSYYQVILSIHLKS